MHGLVQSNLKGASTAGGGGGGGQLLLNFSKNFEHIDHLFSSVA